MLELVESAREDLTERVGAPKTPLTASMFPDDAVAVIYRPARSAMTSGKANTRHWKLRFERRTPPFIEPLMGWTGGDDPLTQVELTFPTWEAAVAYAERQGLTFIVHGQDRTGHTPRGRDTDEVPKEQARPRQQALPPLHRPFTSLRAACGGSNQSNVPDLERALVNPAAVFRSPREVVEHPHLTAACKRELLARWAWDEYLLQLANDEAMPEGREPSRLEVKCALLSLNELDTPLVFVRATSSGDRRAA